MNNKYFTSAIKQGMVASLDNVLRVLLTVDDKGVPTASVIEITDAYTALAQLKADLESIEPAGNPFESFANPVNRDQLRSVIEDVIEHAWLRVGAGWPSYPEDRASVISELTGRVMLLLEKKEPLGIQILPTFPATQVNDDVEDPMRPINATATHVSIHDVAYFDSPHLEKGDIFMCGQYIIRIVDFMRVNKEGQTLYRFAWVSPLSQEIVKGSVWTKIGSSVPLMNQKQ